MCDSPTANTNSNTTVTATTPPAQTTTSTTASAVSIACRIMQQKGLSPRPAATAASYQQPNLVDKTTWLPPRETSSLKAGILKRKSLLAAASKGKGAKNGGGGGGGITIPRPSFNIDSIASDVGEEEDQNEEENRQSPPPSPARKENAGTAATATTTTTTPRRSPRKIVYQKHQVTSSSSVEKEKEKEKEEVVVETSPEPDTATTDTTAGEDQNYLPSPSVARSPRPSSHVYSDHQNQTTYHQKQTTHHHHQSTHTTTTPPPPPPPHYSNSSIQHQHHHQQQQQLPLPQPTSLPSTKKSKTIAATPFSNGGNNNHENSGNCIFFGSTSSLTPTSSNSHHQEQLLELKTAGLTPYRNVSFVETGETFVLCVTPLGDRVAVYYTGPEAAQRSYALSKIPGDYLNGVFLTNEEDAKEIGVEHLVASSGIAAGVANTGFNGPISGIISASTPEEGTLPVYSIIIFNNDPSATGSSGSSSSGNKRTSSSSSAATKASTSSSSGGERGVPSFIILSDRKLFSSHSIFGNENVIRSFGVAPVVKLPQLLKQIQISSDSITKIVRCTTAGIEKQHFSFSGKELTKSIKETTKRISDLSNTFVTMVEMVADAREAETKLLSIERMKHLAAGATSSAAASASTSSSTTLATTGKRLSELSCFASRAEEVFGEASTGIERGLMQAEREIKQAIADLFVETKFYLPHAKGKITDSRSWGYSSHFNQIDFNILSKKVNSQFVNSATATASSTFENLTNNPYTASALEEFPEIVLAVYKANQKN